MPFLRSMCAFCKKLGHSEADCRLKYSAEVSKREAEAGFRKAEAAQRKKLWEAKQAEYMEKKAAWQAKRVHQTARNGQRIGQGHLGAAGLVDLDAKSDCTEATVSTMASVVDAEEVRKIAAQDKDVRRCEKKLRDIANLRQRAADGETLDSLQMAKLAQQGEIEELLEEAWGLAQARAREQLRRQA